MERWQRLSRKLGFAGLGTLGFAFALTLFSMANGIHCPGCDQPPHRDFWDAYFAVKDVVYFASAPMLALAIPLGTPRRLMFFTALLWALGGIALTPR